jgi:DNA-binding beta-propeller fold protein YncE
VTTSPTAPIVAGPGADIAWVTSQTSGGDQVTGIDPDGHVVGRIKAPVELRSSDGAHLYAAANRTVAVYSAADGHQEQNIRLKSVADGPNIPMLSADGRYVALVDGSATLELIDLSEGRSVASIGFGSPAYGVPVIVGAQAQHIYVIGPTSAVKVGFDGSALRVEQRSSGPTPCKGLSVGGVNSAGGLPFRVMADGRTLVAFCPMDGRVSWFDLERMTVTKEIVVSQQNPFWTTPVFSPDGKTLYLDEGGTGALTMVDLTNRRIVRSMKFAAADPNPLALLGSLVVTPVYAGGIPRTAALSPDGTWLYAAGAGVSLVRLPDLSVRGRWVPDVSVNSVWASADGQTIYVLSRGDELHVLRTDGSQVAKLGLPANTYGFIVPTIP